MSSIFERAVLAALGVFSLSKERARKMINELVKEGEMSKSEAAKLVKDLVVRAEKSQKEFSQTIEKTVKKIIKDLDIPTRAELRQIKKEMAKWAKKR